MIQTKGYKLAWLILGILFIIGLFLMDTDREIYPTNEYWVAKNYKHVYLQYTGEIVNTIEEDETCEIKGDEIIVDKKVHGEGWYTFGNILVWMTGMCLAGLLIIFIMEVNDEYKAKYK